VQVEQGEKLSEILPPALLNLTPEVAHGHSLEVRLNCEDPGNAFLPQTGTILKWQAPEGPGIRVDAGFVEGMTVGRSFDPMIGKLIVWGRNRAEARRKMSQTLARTRLIGVMTNTAYLQQVIDSPLFDEHALNTDLLAALPVARSPEFIFEKAAMALLLAQRQNFRLPAELFGFSNSGWVKSRFQLLHRDSEREVYLSMEAEGSRAHEFKIVVEAADGPQTFHFAPQGPGRFQWRRPEHPGETVDWYKDGANIWLAGERGTQVVVDQTWQFMARNKAEGSGTIFAPFAGRVVEMKAQEGDFVRQGATIMVLEAMKMEHQLRAAIDGRVSRLLVSVQSQVMEKQALAEISSEAQS
ncbi:MAG: hypothetical protein M3Q07_04400, partial [Pseudobdellovibrionaceae bacterium]|nr:hypothetical protein [Pseudobdellovibrionaceae bacterium]